MAAHAFQLAGESDAWVVLPPLLHNSERGSAAGWNGGKGTAAARLAL